jgi:hypothetical protein
MASTFADDLHSRNEEYRAYAAAMPASGVK